MDTSNTLFPLDTTRVQWGLAFVALIVLAFASGVSSVPVGIRTSIVLIYGTACVCILGYNGTSPILSGLIATIYIVAYVSFMHIMNNSFTFIFRITVFSFFFSVVIAEVFNKMKYHFASESRRRGLKNLFFAGIFILCVCSITPAIPLAVRITGILVCGGIVSLILGYYAQDNMYAALCVSTAATFGYCLACINDGWLDEIINQRPSPLALFSIIFFIATLLILVGNRYGSARIASTNNFFHDCRYPFIRKCIVIAILATLCVFASTTATHVREASAVSIGLVVALTLGCLEYNRLCVALGVALYLTIALMLAPYFRPYGYVALYMDRTPVVFCMSYLMATLSACAGSLYRIQFLTMYSAFKAACRHRKQRWMVTLYIAAFCTLVFALVLLKIDIKFVEISFLVCAYISAMVLGYLQKGKLYSALLLTVLLTVSMTIPRHFSGRTASKGDFLLATVTHFTSSFAVLLGLIFVGYVCKVAFTAYKTQTIHLLHRER